MPEFSAVHIGILAVMFVVGVVLGWIFRADRCSKEKIAVNASWQEQLEAHKTEHDRLTGQNVGLMEQIGQYQASSKDSNMRAKELSDALKEAFERRDELQRSLKELRNQFDVASAQRDRLLHDIENNNVRDASTEDVIKDRDDKIFHLSRELTSWQSRVPPLVERFRSRDQEAMELRAALDAANERIAELEAVPTSDQTRIEPLDVDTLPDGLDASNEPHDTTTSAAISIPEDQIDQGFNGISAFEDRNLGDDDGDEASEGTEDVVEFPDKQADDVAVKEAEASEQGNNKDQDEEQDRDEAVAVTDDAESDDGQILESGNEQDEEQDRDEAMAVTDDAESDDGQILESGNEQDDLKQIKGIGPAIEKTLNRLGVYRFNQIAEMSEYDIDRVAQQLRGFRSRIYREDWIGQARALQYQKNNDYD